MLHSVVFSFFLCWVVPVCINQQKCEVAYMLLPAFFVLFLCLLWCLYFLLLFLLFPVASLMLADETSVAVCVQHISCCMRDKLDCMCAACCLLYACGTWDSKLQPCIEVLSTSQTLMSLVRVLGDKLAVQSALWWGRDSSLENKLLVCGSCACCAMMEEMQLGQHPSNLP